MRDLLGQSVDVLLHDRARKRADELVKWRVAAEQIFKDEITVLRLEERLVDFFIEFGLPVLYEDLARKMNRSFREELVRPICGHDMKGLLRMTSSDTMSTFLLTEGLIRSREHCQFVLDSAVISAEQLAFQLWKASFDGCEVFPAYFQVGVLLTVVGWMLSQYRARHRNSLHETIVPYLAEAFRRDSVKVFFRIASTLTRMYGRNMVEVTEDLAAVATIDEGPRSRRRISAKACDSADELAAFVEELVDHARSAGEKKPSEETKCSGRDRRVIGLLCGLVFESQLPHRPADDRERKASVLCALTFNEKMGEWRKIYRTYAVGPQKVLEGDIRPFWTQKFSVGGVTDVVLFTVTKDGRPQLCPIWPWPRGIVGPAPLLRRSGGHRA